MYTILAQIEDLKTNVKGNFISGYEISKDEILDALSSIAKAANKWTDHTTTIGELLESLEECGKSVEDKKLSKKIIGISDKILHEVCQIDETVF